MIFSELHPILKRQLIKNNINETFQENENLSHFIAAINQAYTELDKMRYLTERSMEISSQEMHQLYENIKEEKDILQNAFDTIKQNEKELIGLNAELTEKKNYIAGILGSISDIMLLLDTNLNIVNINSITTTMFNCNENDFVSKNIENFVNDVIPLKNLIKNIKQDAGKKNFDSFATEIKFNDIRVPVLLSASLLLNSNNEILNIVCLAKDISKIKELEAQNAQKQTMLLHAGRLASLGEMATGIAHELNQPLSIIKTNMQSVEFLLNEKISIDDLKEIISSTIRQVDRASKIINHMRNFSRINQNEKIEPIDILEPIENALSMFNEQFRLHEIKIIKNFEPSIPKVFIHAHELEQIVVNLLFNSRYAVEAMKEKFGPESIMQININVKYVPVEHSIMLEVQDNGTGMTEETKNHCYEPFYTTKEVGEGTGLGLSIIYNIIKSLKGKIELESEIDKGTTIRIFLREGSHDGVE